MWLGFCDGLFGADTSVYLTLIALVHARPQRCECARPYHMPSTRHRSMEFFQWGYFGGDTLAGSGFLIRYRSNGEDLISFTHRNSCLINCVISSSELRVVLQALAMRSQVRGYEKIWEFSYASCHTREQIAFSVECGKINARLQRCDGHPVYETDTRQQNV